jgi:plastocyanin domain-containing protein
MLAFFNVGNGLNLLGVPQVLGAVTSKATAKSDPNVTMVNGVQVVRMTQASSGYSPNKFTIKKGIPVKWIVTSKDAYSCASSIVSQQLSIRKSLELGENVFEFTPKEAGTIRFSCSMGMYTGSFTVVDETGSAPSTTQIASTTQAQNTQAAGSCSASGGGCGCGAKKQVIAQNNNLPAGETVNQGNVQLIKTTYTASSDIQPNTFTVKANQPVRFEIDAKEDGQGCMGSITVPTLTQKIEILTKGEKVVFEFTPTSKGTYNITCGMGMQRGQIQVI